jgi:hypothetical protein
MYTYFFRENHSLKPYIQKQTEHQGLIQKTFIGKIFTSWHLYFFLRCFDVSTGTYHGRQNKHCCGNSLNLLKFLG